MSQHSEWLSLIEYSGPFLAEPVLEQAFPQELPTVDQTKRKLVRQAYGEWREAQLIEDPELESFHAQWIELILGRVLDYDIDGNGDELKWGNDIPEYLNLNLPEHDLTLRPDAALCDPDSNDVLLLLTRFPPGTDLEVPITGASWATSPADRMMHLCRSTKTRLGLVTNGERWLLVDAPDGGVISFASWYAGIWVQEPITLQAFVALLNINRFYGEPDRVLPKLFDRSLEFQSNVTETLGEQVHRAIEVLIQALDKANEDRNHELLIDLEPGILYESALTVMMRLVFVLSAEERDLLLLGDEGYETNYALSTLRMQLREETEEVLEHRYDAWSRLLALFRAIYGGIEHENLRLPALGGSLFDPDRFPFLEGRALGSRWQDTLASPLPIDNRTVLILLDSIQLYKGRTLSYRGLDIEQLGYVYEGLLDHTVQRMSEVTLDLRATRSSSKPWVTLNELETALNVNELLQERTGSSANRITNDLSRVVVDDMHHNLLAACGNDVSLYNRIKPYAYFLRVDPWGDPLIYPEGTFSVMRGAERRQTGSHYTPKVLTEAIVTETLTPIVYIGPSEGKDKQEWKLKLPDELLSLKICDPAMGSGAFLVQVCRWLGERVVESWSQQEESGRHIDANGNVVDSLDGVEPMPLNSDERLIIARRLVAERCLYGVDMNPLAVELAKLSIWLVTLAKGHPFGFLDHNLRHGDSLMGLRDLEQLYHFHMDPEEGKVIHHGLFDPRALISENIHEAIELRKSLREIPIRDIRDVERMAELDNDARSVLSIPIELADALVSEAYACGDNSNSFDREIVILADLANRFITEDDTELRSRTNNNLNLDPEHVRRPFHWALEFPEVFENEDCGFDAIVGNPPFMGGQRITGNLGKTYREYLVHWLAYGQRGSADLVTYFFLRVFTLIKHQGTFGLLAVNTIAEGNTREVGLDRLLSLGGIIFSAFPNEPWPGAANVITSRVHIIKGIWEGQILFDSTSVPYISAHLTTREHWDPLKLDSNKHWVFQGSIILGDGFLIEQQEVEKLLRTDKKHKEVLYQYLIGKEVNQHPRHEPSRWVINFFDWSEEKILLYEDAYKKIELEVKPERQRLKDDGTFQLRKPLPQRWWQYAEKRPALYHHIGRGSLYINHPNWWNSDDAYLKQVIVFATGATKYPCFTIVHNEYIFAHSLCVIASQSYTLFACLSSDIHAIWAWEYGSKMKQDLRYTHGDIFETFPFPNGVLEDEHRKLTDVGKRFFLLRRKYMLANEKGMTKFYNDLHNPELDDPMIRDLRNLQIELNDTVLNTFDFTDINPEYNFHEVNYLPEGKNIRFTISERAREELLYRLAMLNKERYEDEQLNESHSTKNSNFQAKKKRKKKKAKKNIENSQQSLFEMLNNEDH